MAKLLNWHNFSGKLREKKIFIFSPLDVRRLFGSSAVAANFLLHRYAQKGFVLRLRQGLYAFPDAIPSELFIANKLYEPSYVSLEFALSYHGIIPENVYEITSVTTKSTRRFKSLGKIYSYRRIKKSAFTGYTLMSQNGFTFFIAEPEKAFVDTSYFRLYDGLPPLSRFSKKNIKPGKALRYAALFNNKKISDIIKKILR